MSAGAQPCLIQEQELHIGNSAGRSAPRVPQGLSVSFPRQLILFALAYWAGAELSYVLLAKAGNFSAFWPPAGIYLGVLLVTPRRRWWAVALAAAVPNFLADVVVHRQTVWSGLGFLLVNLCAPLLAAALLARLCRPAFLFERLSHVVTWLLVVAFISVPLGAFGGAAIIVNAWSVAFPQKWFLWWVGDLLGTLALTPLAYDVFGGVFGKPAWPQRKTVVEAAALLLSLGVATVFVFRFSQVHALPPAVLYLFLMWAALRFGAGMVAASATVLATIALWMTSLGFGPFIIQQTAQGRALMAQVMAAVGALLFYILAAVMAERRTAESELHRGNLRLDEQVKARTAELLATNERLRANETALQLALEASQAGAWSWDVTTNVAAWDDRYHSLYGFDAGVARSVENWLDAVYPNDRPQLTERLAAMFAAKDDDVWNQEFRTLHPVKGERWMHGLGRLERDADGRPLRMSGLNLDITERKRREANLVLLAEIAGNFNQLTAPDEIMQAIGARVGAFLGVKSCNFARIDEARDEVTYLGQWNAPGEPPLPPKVSLSAHVSEEFRCRVRAGETIVSHNTQTNPITKGAENAKVGALAFITVPFHQGGEWQYLISVHDTRPRQWRADEIELVHELAQRTFPRLERARAEAALRESEERYRTVVNNQSEMLCRFRSDGRILFVNPAYARARGTTLEALLEGNFWDFVAAEDQPAVREMLDRLTPEAPEIQIENRFETTEGVRRTLWTNRALVFDAAGRMIEAQATGIDITERKALEDALRAAHDTFRHLVEHSPFGIYVVDADFRLAMVGAGAQKVFANVRPLIGRDFAEVLRVVWPDPFAAELIDIFRHTLATGEPYHSPSTVEQRGDIDAVEAYDWKTERITLPDGRFGVVCHFYDLSERQRYEAALRESREELRAFINATSDTIYEMSADWRVMRSLEGKEFIATTENARADWMEEYIPEDERPRVWGAINRAIETKSIFELEHRVVRLDGTIGWTFSRAVPLFDEQGEIVKWFGAVSDTTESKELELEREQVLAREQRARQLAEEANRAKDDWLAMVSHELRTPLNAILGHARLLDLRRDRPASELPELPELLAFADLVRRNGERQNEMINDLLDTARITTGKLRLEIAPLDLATVIREALDAVEPSAKAKDIVLLTELEPRAGVMTGDAARLQQVALNLLTNAVKFTPYSGVIMLKLSRDTRQVVLKVSDTGAGIAPDFLPHIFERFSQGDTSRTRRHGGLGLGLSLVKQIVELHGGRITAASDGVGCGTTFNVTLPLGTAGQRDKEKGNLRGKETEEKENGSADFQLPVSSSTALSLFGVRALLVEDDADARALVALLLESFGAEVRTANDAAAAWESLTQDERPHVLLCDIALPEEDGLNLLRRWREREREHGTPPLPALALTAQGSAKDRLQSLLAGFQMHITKPAEPEELALTIKNLLDRASARPSNSAWREPYIS